MGDVNLEIKLGNLDERVIKIEESGGGSGGDGYITSVSDDFNVVNKKLSLSNDVTTKLSKVDDKIDKPTSATEGQVLTYRNNEWVADDSQGGGQFVIIVKGETHEGQTVTATKGTKSKSAVITSGVARIPVDEGGVWTLTLSSGETLNTPNMTYYGEYEVLLAPNGATVTPTDDVQTWLNCANIWDKTDLTAIDDVIADTTTLNILISDNNASDYLVRSTTWASDVCASESAMTYIGLNDYCANKLLADSTWLEAICSTSEILLKKVLNVFVPTLDNYTGSDGGVVSASSEYDSGRKAYFAFDGTTNSWCAKSMSAGEWIQYNFKRNVKISYMVLEEDLLLRFPEMKISGSNDNGVNFTDIITITTTSKDVKRAFINNEAYQIYRLTSTKTITDTNTAIAKLQFYGREA